jgi:hypothetical protein
MLFMVMRRASRTRRKQSGHWAPFLNRPKTPEQIAHQQMIMQRYQELTTREHMDEVQDQRNAWRIQWWEFWNTYHRTPEAERLVLARLDRLDGWKLAIALAAGAPGYIKRRYKEL